MLVSVLEKINNAYESFFSPVDCVLAGLPAADWITDALCDSIHLIPFLFAVFVIIEFIEFYHADKVHSFLESAKNGSIAVGALASIIPQCGFSVIASSMYTKRIITRGCLIAVYLATSDETIPILIATPAKTYLIVPLIVIKLVIGMLAGYAVDFIIPQKFAEAESTLECAEEGCCKHGLEHKSRRELFVHPVVHTLNVFGFILAITLILNFCLENAALTDYICGGKYIQPVIASFAGLIPNCAISIGITMMLIKGTITFGAAMSGLLANAGLGLLVLLKNNDFKDTLKIILILLIVSIVSGIAINVLTDILFHT